VERFFCFEIKSIDPEFVSGRIFLKFHTGINKNRPKLIRIIFRREKKTKHF